MPGRWSRCGPRWRPTRPSWAPAGDWTMVKVWYAPQGSLGTSAYPTRGFIYSGHAHGDDEPDASTSVIATAAAAPMTSGIPLDR